MDRDQIAKSQGINVSRIGRPFSERNRIEEALLPTLNKSQPATVPAPEPRRQNFKKTRTALLAIFTLAILGLFGYGANMVYKQFDKAKAEAPASVLENVGRLIALPEGEEPTVATIQDLAPLKGEAFFANAAVGDKVIIYAEAKKAILYRPATNKIIIVAPVR